MARDWVALPKYQLEPEVPRPNGWDVYQVESLYEPLDAGNRYDQRTVAASGRVPVLDQSASGYIGFHNDDAGIQASKIDPVVTFANHTCEMRLMREPFSAIQNVFPMRGRTNICSSEFLYYVTKGRVRLSEYKGHHPEFRRMWVAIPSLGEQRAIAEVLGALDDKIAANTKLARTADELVRSRHLAVDAEAVDRVFVSDLVTAIGDKVEPGSLDSATPYVGLEHSQRHMMWLGDVGDADAVTSTKSAFAPGDVLFGKLRPYFHKVVAAPSPGVCSTDVLVLRPKDRELFGFVLAALTTDRVVERSTAASGGTRMPRTSWKDLAAIDIAWPGVDGARAFSREVHQIHEAVIAQMKENVTLAATRDALLPHLMSGRLRVKDAEAVL